MADLEHLRSNVFLALVIVFIFCLIFALKSDIEKKRKFMEEGTAHLKKHKHYTTFKICNSTLQSATRGCISGFIIGGPGGALAGAFVMGVSGGISAAVAT